MKTFKFQNEPDDPQVYPLNTLKPYHRLISDYRKLKTNMILILSRALKPSQIKSLSDPDLSKVNTINNYKIHFSKSFAKKSFQIQKDIEIIHFSPFELDKILRPAKMLVSLDLLLIPQLHDPKDYQNHVICFESLKKIIPRIKNLVIRGSFEHAVLDMLMSSLSPKIYYFSKLNIQGTRIHLERLEKTISFCFKGKFMPNSKNSNGKRKLLIGLVKTQYIFPTISEFKNFFSFEIKSNAIEIAKIGSVINSSPKLKYFSLTDFDAEKVKLFDCLVEVNKQNFGLGKMIIMTLLKSKELKIDLLNPSEFEEFEFKKYQENIWCLVIDKRYSNDVFAFDFNDYFIKNAKAILDFLNKQITEIKLYQKYGCLMNKLPSLAFANADPNSDYPDFSAFNSGIAEILTLTTNLRELCILTGDRKCLKKIRKPLRKIKTLEKIVLTVRNPDSFHFLQNNPSKEDLDQDELEEDYETYDKRDDDKKVQEWMKFFRELEPKYVYLNFRGHIKIYRNALYHEKAEASQ